MKWVLLVVVLGVLVASPALAITMDCPASAEQNEPFSISVSHTGATQVRLYYASSWHTTSGSSGSWSVTESNTGAHPYYGSAFVGGEWIGTSSDKCTVTITEAAPDTPGSMSLSALPSTIEYGETVSVSATFTDADGTNRIDAYRNGAILGAKTFCAGTSCTYTLTDTPPSTGSLVYVAIGRDSNGNPTSASTTVFVTGATVPVVSLVVSPTSLTTGQQASFAVSGTDAGGDLTQIKVFYGDGTSATQACSGGAYSKTWTHSYATSGTKTAYATVLDSDGHAAQSQSVAVAVAAPRDADADGIPDATDVCDNTPTSWRPIVTATGDAYLGCACAEIVNVIPDPTRDANPCTDDTCAVTNGAFQAVHTPVPDGTQPEGYVDGCTGDDWLDYSCMNGAVSSTPSVDDPRCVTCTAHASQACWPDDTGDPYWYDSCSNREQPAIDTCTATETCTVQNGIAACVACTPSCTACGASDGCGGFCDVASCPSGQACAPSGDGFACVVTGCTADAACAGSLPYCDLSSGVCVACLTSAQCADADACTADTCSGFACVHAAVPPVCPSSGSVACGVALTPSNQCGACTGSGTLCDADGDGLQDPGYVCSSSGCVLGSVVVNPAPGSVLVREGASFTIIVGVDPAPAGLLVQASGMPGLVVGHPEGQDWQVTKVVGRADLGMHTVTIDTRLSATGSVLGTAQVPVAVSCAETNPCCQEYAYLTDGEACVFDGDPNGGFCDAQGVCVENCVPNAYRACHEGAIYYFDSCDAVGELSQSCGPDEVCTETGGAPACQPLPPTCTLIYDYFCRSGDVYRTDTGCGLTELSQECTRAEQCVEGVGTASCAPRSACAAVPGTVDCNGACVDPLVEREHCGGCGRTCARDEQCVQGVCTAIPGCVVICDRNEECDENQVCVNAGSCTESECQTVNVLAQNDSDVQVLATELLTQGLVQVATALEGNAYVFTASNLGPNTLRNVSITSRFEKLVASSAAQLAVRGVDYAVIEDDPVLEFVIPVLDDHFAWRVAATNFARLDEEQLALTSILHVRYRDPDFLAAWNETRDALTMGLNTEFDGERTKVHLTLQPNKNLEGVNVPIQIPKCMAAYVDEMELDGTYQVVKDDPLIVWQFDELSKPAEITFSVPKDIDEECKAQLKAMAVARGVGKPINPWFLVGLVPVIFFTLIFFQRFGPARHTVLRKEEYYRIGRDQEQMSEEDLERGWRDYKRRFR